MGRYVAAIRRGLDGAGVEAPLTIMQSSGGVMTSADATVRPGAGARVRARRPGVVAALALARRHGGNAIAFDMGGTTAKASLIEGGAVSRAREYEAGGSLSTGSRLMRGAGELLRIPSIDIAEVGAGGGSIAWLDPAGGLQVGPAERRRRAGARLLRPRRRGADGHRRERLPRLHPGRPARLGRPLGLAGARRACARADRRAARAHARADGGRRPRDRERAHDARAALGLVGEGPRPARLRADRLRRLRPGARVRASPRSSAARPSSSPRSPASSARSASSSRGPSSTTSTPATSTPAPCRRRELDRDPRRARGADRAVARRRRSSGCRRVELRYGGQSWEVEVELRRSAVDEAARDDLIAPLRGRARAALRRPRRARLPDRDPRAAARRPRPVARRSTACALADVASRPSGTRAARFDGELVDTPVRSRALDRRDGPSRGRCSSTSTTRPSSSARAGPSAATPTTETLVLERAWLDADRRGSTRSPSRSSGNALASIADEMATTIFRTAHSTVVRDGMDFSAALCDPRRRDRRPGRHRPVPPRLGPARDGRRCSRSGATRCAPATCS